MGKLHPRGAPVGPSTGTAPDGSTERNAAVEESSEADLALACLGLFGACSGGEEATPKDEGRPLETKPETANADGFGPVSAPAGFEEVTGDGFIVAVPPGVQGRETSSNGEPMLLLNAAESPGSVVGVVRDVRPRAHAIEQSITLEARRAWCKRRPTSLVRRSSGRAPNGRC